MDAVHSCQAANKIKDKDSVISRVISHSCNMDTLALSTNNSHQQHIPKTSFHPIPIACNAATNDQMNLSTRTFLNLLPASSSDPLFSVVNSCCCSSPVKSSHHSLAALSNLQTILSPSMMKSSYHHHHRTNPPCVHHMRHMFDSHNGCLRREHCRPYPYVNPHANHSRTNCSVIPTCSKYASSAEGESTLNGFNGRGTSSTQETDNVSHFHNDAIADVWRRVSSDSSLHHRLSATTISCGSGVGTIVSDELNQLFRRPHSQIFETHLFPTSTSRLSSKPSNSLLLSLLSHSTSEDEADYQFGESMESGIDHSCCGNKLPIPSSSVIFTLDNPCTSNFNVPTSTYVQGVCPDTNILDDFDKKKEDDQQSSNLIASEYTDDAEARPSFNKIAKEEFANIPDSVLTPVEETFQLSRGRCRVGMHLRGPRRISSMIAAEVLSSCSCKKNFSLPVRQ